MEQGLTVFKNNRFEIRVGRDDDGEPFWVAKEICEMLGISTEQARRLDEDEKGLRSIQTPGGMQDMVVVNEPGLYSLILGSRKPDAKDFKRWITHDVIPSIRRHGAYMTPETIEKVLADPDTIIRLATDLKEERARRQALEAERQVMLPKATFFDAVADSKTAIDMGTVAKVLDCGIGRNTLFQMLRDKDILMWNNQPRQNYIDRGYFRVIEQKYTKPDGSIEINIKTLVYQRGLDFILKTLNLAPRKAA